MGRSFYLAEAPQAKNLSRRSRTYGDLHVSCDSHFWMCNHQIGKGTVVTDATYWTERVEATHRRVLKFFVCFATCRARNFPLILVDVLPREVRF